MGRYKPPKSVELFNEIYLIDDIKKESPEEMVSFTREIIAFGGLSSLVGFLSTKLIPFLFILLIILEFSPIAFILFISMGFFSSFTECYAFKWKCGRSKKENRKCFPHIKVSDGNGVVTTMSPRAYVGQFEYDEREEFFSILPLKIKRIGSFHDFSIEKFELCLQQSLKIREKRKEEAEKKEGKKVPRTSSSGG